MLSPSNFLKRYREISVPYDISYGGGVCKQEFAKIKLRTYFMSYKGYDTKNGGSFQTVTSGTKKDNWYKENRLKLVCAAYGKGSPDDYKSALFWAVKSGKIKKPTPTSIQSFCDKYLGIDCSGFVTNYLIATGKQADHYKVKLNTNAAKYFSLGTKVNENQRIKQGDILVWLKNNKVKRSPGHVTLVDTYIPACTVNGNMRVSESTGTQGVSPKLLTSAYHVKGIIARTDKRPYMMLDVLRHGGKKARVAVVRM